MKNVIKWICWFFAFGCSISVQAAIVQGNDPNQAAGDDGFNLTIDTNTGLRWLDLTLTNGRSFNDVSSNFAVGGDYEGYRHATRDEILSFWSNAGINYTANYIHQPDNSMAISSLMEKLGLTLDLTYDGGLGIYKGAGGWFDDTAYRPGATSLRGFSCSIVSRALRVSHSVLITLNASVHSCSRRQYSVLIQLSLLLVICWWGLPCRYQRPSGCSAQLSLD